MKDYRSTKHHILFKKQKNLYHIQKYLQPKSVQMKLFEVSNQLLECMNSCDRLWFSLKQGAKKYESPPLHIPLLLFDTSARFLLKFEWIRPSTDVLLYVFLEGASITLNWKTTFVLVR